MKMKSILLLSLVALCCLSTCVANDMLVGSSYNARLTWQQKVEYMGIPFKKRVKEFFYSDPSQQIIKGVVVREPSRSGASSTITAGGVGFSYVNLRFKSDRGSGLNYNVDIYV